MHIPIKETGSYLLTDSKGFIIPEASLVLVQEKWKPVIDDYVHGFVSRYRDNIHSIYIRGSVAKGQAVDHVSDFDAIVVTKERVLKEDRGWTKHLSESLLIKYPFVTKFEMVHHTPNELLDNPWRGNSIVLKLQSFCAYGKDLRDSLPRIHISKSSIHAKDIQKEIAEILDDLANKNLTHAEIERDCTWIMKRILRTAHELVAVRSGRFTRDLYRCWEGFSEYYPERKDGMYKILDLALTPILDIHLLTKTLEEVYDWLPQEIKEYL